MKQFDVVLLLSLGLVIWIAGTIYYAAAGPLILETTAVRYWRALVLSSVSSAALCVLLLRWRRIAPADWTSAMLLLAIPGMIGEAVVLTNLGVFMPKLHAETGGKYAAFLFVTYAFVLALAEIVTLRSAP